MRKIILVVSIPFLLLVFSCKSTEEAVSEQEKILAELQSELDMKNRMLDDMLSSSSADAETIDQLQMEIDRLNSDLNELNGAYFDMQNTLAAQEELENRLRNQARLIKQLEFVIDQKESAISALESMNQANDNTISALESGNSADAQALAALAAEKAFLENERDRLMAAYDQLSGDVQRELEKTDRAVADLRNQLADEIAAGDIEILTYNGLIIIHIKNRILFNPDRAEIRPENEDVLLNIARVFSLFPDRVIRVEGHTAQGRDYSYPSSWELGAARSVNIVRFFQDKAGIEPQRLVAVSFGEFRPLTSNDTEEGKMQNRRVEIILINKPLYQWQELME